MAFELFGFEIKSKKKGKKGKTFVTPENLDGATQIIDGGGILGHYLNTDSDAQDENKLVQKYRDMAFSHEVDGAIEDIINDAVIHEEGVPAVALDLESLESHARSIAAISVGYISISYNTIGLPVRAY